MWIFLSLSYIVVLFLADYGLRKKHWRNNSVEEKRSLLIYITCGILYLICSMMSVFMGMAGEPYMSGFGLFMFKTAAYMSMAMPLVCLAVLGGNILLRKKNHLKKANQLHLIAIVYILLTTVITFMADAI